MDEQLWEKTKCLKTFEHMKPNESKMEKKITMILSSPQKYKTLKIHQNGIVIRYPHHCVM